MLIDDTFNPKSKAMDDMKANFKISNKGQNGDSINPHGAKFGLMYAVSSDAEKEDVDEALAKLYVAKKSTWGMDMVKKCLAESSKTTLMAADNAVINAAMKEKKKLMERMVAIHSFNADRTDEIIN